MNACAKGCFVCLRTFRRRRPEKKRDIDASLFTMRCSVWSFIRRSIILFLVSALHVFVSVHLAPSLSLMKGSTQIALFFFFFPGLTYTNVLMDRGDKDNEGEERGDEEWRREGQYATHTRTHTDEVGNSRGRQILWAWSPPRLGERELKVTCEWEGAERRRGRLRDLKRGGAERH